MEKCPGTAGNSGPLGNIRGKGVPGQVEVKLPLSRLKKGMGGAPGAGGKSTVVQPVISTDSWLGLMGTPRLSRP